MIKAIEAKKELIKFLEKYNGKMIDTSRDVTIELTDCITRDHFEEFVTLLEQWENSIKYHILKLLCDGGSSHQINYIKIL